MTNLLLILLLVVGCAQACIEGVEVELWGECYNIEETTSLILFFQELTGEIPPEIGQLENLTYLNLSSNNLSGEIPPEIGQLENLIYLNLRNVFEQ